MVRPVASSVSSHLLAVGCMLFSFTPLIYTDYDYAVHSILVSETLTVYTSYASYARSVYVETDKSITSYTFNSKLHINNMY